jgi:D-alanine transaminase
MSRIAYVNGRYLPQRDASVNIEDRGYQFADGIYEVIYLQAGRFVDEALHLDRLDRSLREIALQAPMPRASLRHVLQEVASRNRVRDGLLYMQVTRGVARRDHAFPQRPIAPALVVTVRHAKPYPKSVDAWAVQAITHPDQRWLRCDIKSTGLLANVLARQAAREKGAAEALLFDQKGMVTEGAATSVWIVDKEGVLRVPQLDSSILPGCTRAALLQLLAEAGIEASLKPFSVEALRQAREVFLTSATSFVKPVTQVDGAPVADGKVGPMTRRLFDMFARHVVGGLPNAA